MGDDTVREFDGPGVGVDDDIDPDLAPVGRVELLDLIQEVEEELRDEVPAREGTVKVPGRPGYEIRYSTEGIDYDTVTVWRKRSADDKKPGGSNELTFGAIVIANACQAIVRNGEDLVLDGQVATFRSKRLIEILGAIKAVHAVKKLFGNDFELIAASWEILSDAGISRPDENGEDGEDLDEGPTSG